MIKVKVAKREVLRSIHGAKLLIFAIFLDYTAILYKYYINTI